MFLSAVAPPVRVLLLVLFLEVVLTVALVAGHRQVVTQLYSDQLSSHAYSLVSQFVKNTSRFYQSPTLGSQLDESAHRLVEDASVSYVLIVDRDGQQVVSAGAVLPDMRLIEEEQAPKSVTDGVFDVVVRLMVPGSSLESVWVGFSLQPMSQSIDTASMASIKRAVLVLLVVMLLTCLVGWLLLKNRLAGRLIFPSAHSHDVAEQFAKTLSKKGNDFYYQRLAEVGTQGYWQVDAEQRTIYVNRAMAAMLGYAVDDMLGKTLFSFFDEGMINELIAKRKQGVVEQHAICTQHKDGHNIYLEVAAVPLFEGDRYLGAMAGIVDVSEYYRQQLDLQRSQQLLQWSQKVARVGSWSLQVATRRLVIEQGKLGVLGPESTIVFQSAEDYLPFIHPDSKPELVAGLERAISTRSAFRMDYQLCLEDGSVAWLYAEGIPVLNEAGELIELSGVFQEISERKKIEQELRLREEDLKVTLHSIGEGMLATDSDGVITRMNRMAEQITGWAVAESIGKSVSEVFTVVDSEGAETEDGRLDQLLTAAEAKGMTGSYVLRAKGDQLCRVKATVARIVGNDGSVGGAILVFSDSSEEYLREQALKESELRYRSIFDSSGEGIFVLDEYGQILDANHSCLVMTGYTEGEILQLNARDLLVESNQQKLGVFLKEIAAKGQAASLALLSRKNGEPMPIETRGVAFTLQGGSAILGIMLDITERVEAERELKRSAVVFDATTDGILVTDADQIIVAANRACTEITGYSNEEIVGKTPRLFKSGRQDDLFYSEMWEQIINQGSWQGELWNRRKSGELFPVLQSVNAVTNSQGEVTNYVGVFLDISQLKQTEAQLAQLAHYDTLTGLPNRILLDQKLDQAMSAASRRKSKMAVLFLDLDRFKLVNDSLGHPIGDQLLVEIAERLKLRIRAEDTLARLGGDEFLILLEHLNDPEEAGIVADDLIKALGEPFELGGQYQVYIGASIGISIYPDDGVTKMQLQKNADAAMYQAKEQGRNTFRYYTEALTQKANRRLLMETLLRQALSEKQIEVYYQPQISLETGELTGAEALARWPHPTEGMISPEIFIPLAEDTGSIIALGEQVMAQVCQQYKRWGEEGIALPKISINLSPRQLVDSELVTVVEAAIAASGQHPSLFEFEITESTIMECGDEASQVIESLKQLGVSMAIDDFGTGYSSLARLKYFSIERLKIDQSFVRDIVSDSSDAEIVATIIAMAHKLNLSVIAEGVETEAQKTFLQQQGCDSMQGYLCSKPLSAEAYGEFLRERRGQADVVGA